MTRYIPIGDVELPLPLIARALGIPAYDAAIKAAKDEVVKQVLEAAQEALESCDDMDQEYGAEAVIDKIKELFP